MRAGADKNDEANIDDLGEFFEEYSDDIEHLVQSVLEASNDCYADMNVFGNKKHSAFIKKQRQSLKKMNQQLKIKKR